ncbi:MAG: hypothetical protein EX285_04640 [Thaumarchaeota archaeon]|nr:hypothetical protein [Nitrososphaerota archaeon]
MKSLLLQGYGCSIKVKDTRLVFSQGTHAFSKEKEIIEYPALACPFDKAVIQEDGYVSTKALQYLAEANINVVMLDRAGSYFHQVGGHESLLRKKQYDTFFNEVKVNELRKWIVSERITSQIQLFKELVTEPKKFYNRYNKKWQISDNQHSNRNYSLSINEEVKEEIKRLRE